MRYARKGPDSDVDIRRTGEQLVCSECRLIDVDHVTTNASDMLDHLHEHIQHWHMVPPHALELLYAESEPDEHV